MCIDRLRCRRGNEILFRSGVCADVVLILLFTRNYRFSAVSRSREHRKYRWHQTRLHATLFPAIFAVLRVLSFHVFNPQPPLPQTLNEGLTFDEHNPWSAWCGDYFSGSLLHSGMCWISVFVLRIPTFDYLEIFRFVFRLSWLRS